MERVSIIAVGLRTAFGSLNQTWQSILDGQPPRYSIDLEEDQEHRLFKLAKFVIDELIRGHPDLKIDAVCVGSSSAGFSELERGLRCHSGYLVDAVAHEYSILTRFQISQACSSSSYAIALGVDLIRSGRAKVVLAGGVDELTSCVVSAFKAARLHSKTVCRPFDVSRDGLVLSEASAFVLLARSGVAPPLAFVDGIGLSSDAFSSVGESVEGISRAIRAAVQEAGKIPSYVIAHGTGTRINDLVEGRAILSVLPSFVPVTSYKGILGHPQGASGAVGVALAVKSLQVGVAFPCVGFRVADPDIGVVTVTGVTKDAVDSVLCLAYGSWGTNAAIMVGNGR